MKGWTAVILAAGEGKRMNSRKPKVLHAVAGRPMLQYGVSALREAGLQRLVVIIGQGGDEVRRLLDEGVLYAEQRERRGTGHALLQAHAAAGESQAVLVLNGDVPLVTAASLQRLISHHQTTAATVTFATARLASAADLGRVQRDASGRPTAIVEATEVGTLPSNGSAAADGDEVNAGIYCFGAEWLWPRLAALPAHKTGEYYLTDLVAMAAAEGQPVEAVCLENAEEILGINDRLQLARAEAVLRRRIRQRLMADGVTLIDPDSVYIDADVSIGSDTVVYPNTFISGHSRIGEECILGPSSVIADSVIGHRCRVTASMLEGATLEDDVDVGPFSHLRPGAYLCSGVHIGNFGEVKNARLGHNTAMGHLGYIGDAQVGDEVNIGAGTITCNYDGVRKNETVIGNKAFIGSDTLLVAPVRVGDGAVTGAGAVVLRDIPPDSLAVGVPARILRKLPPAKKGE